MDLGRQRAKLLELLLLFELHARAYLFKLALMLKNWV